MRSHKPTSRSKQTSEAINLVLREAKRLHRSATSESLASSLPVLRRLIASRSLEQLSLPELRRRRTIIQRKHILRMLAIEAGYSSWEAYRPAIANASLDEVEHFDVVRRRAGYPNVWFSSLAEAKAFADEHGGRPLCVGRQAVVLVEET